MCELGRESLVQQRLLQSVQRIELLLVDGFEAPGFFGKRVEFCDESSLNGNFGGKGNLNELQQARFDSLDCRSRSLGADALLERTGEKKVFQKRSIQLSFVWLHNDYSLRERHFLVRV